MNVKPATIQPALLKLLIAIAGLLILPLSLQLNPLFIGIGFSLLIWRFSTLYRPKLSPNKWLLLPLSLSLGFMVMKTFGMSFGRDASSSLLVILMGLKLLECHHQRDVQALIYLFFFVLITPFLFDQRIVLALYAVAIFFCLLFALMMNNTGSRTLQQPALLKISGLILLQAIPLMLVSFIFFPRMIGPLWAMPDETSAISGLSDQINPGAISNLALSDATAFRVRFTDSTPQQKDLYWRGLVFWDTDGKRWSHKSPSEKSFKNATSWPTSSEDYRYTLMMEPHQQLWLYALDRPAAAPKNTRLSDDHQLTLKRKLSRNLSFELRSSISTPLLTLSPQDRQRALHLPTSTQPRVLALAKKWRNKAKTNQQIVQLALQFYHAEFYYTLRPPSLGKHPVDEFLFNTKRGFCGHFASSFATLMRAAGIPARLIGGYQGGVYNTVGGFYNIRQADAHVWVEVWLQQQGWVRVDPTAAIAPNRIEHSIDASLQRLNGDVNFLLQPPEGFKQWAQQFNWAIHSIDYYWQNAVLAYGPEKQLEFLSQLGISDWGGMVIWLSIGSGLMILLTMAMILLVKRSNPDRVQAAYLKLCKKLAKKAGKRQPHETISLYFERIQPYYPTKTSELKRIQQLYLKTRYGKQAENAFLHLISRFRL